MWQSDQRDEERSKLLGAHEVRIVFVYLVCASLWIVGSDIALQWIEHDPIDSAPLQTAKGLNFVFTTAFLLFIVLRRSYNRWRVAEEDLRQSEQRFASVARAVTSALWDWDLVTHEIWWSDGFFRLFGYSRMEVGPTIDGWKSRIHPEDRDRVVGAIERFVEVGDGAWTDEYRLRRKDGTYAVVEDRGVLIRNAAGVPIRMVGGIHDVTERRRAEDGLERSRQQLRALSARLQSLREEERTRIAREIHDELGQMVTGLKMELRSIERRLSENVPPSPEPVLEKVLAASELADAIVAAVQRIAAELRPSVLDTLGLAAAVEQEAMRFQERTGIACRIQCPDFAPPPADDTATTAFRILQEALTNVARHAQASEVSLHLWSKDGELHAEIADNGRGIPEDDLQSPDSLGLLGMRERAALLRGDVTIGRGPRGGTLVSLRLPLDKTALEPTLPSR